MCHRLKIVAAQPSWHLSNEFEVKHTVPPCECSLSHSHGNGKHMF